MAMAMTVAIPRGTDAGLFEDIDFVGEERAC